MTDADSAGRLWQYIKHGPDVDGADTFPKRIAAVYLWWKLWALLLTVGVTGLLVYEYWGRAATPPYIWGFAAATIFHSVVKP